MFNTKISAETKASMKLAAKVTAGVAAVAVAVVYRQEIGNAAVTGFNAIKNTLGCATDTVVDTTSTTLE